MARTAKPSSPPKTDRRTRASPKKGEETLSSRPKAKPKPKSKARSAPRAVVKPVLRQRPARPAIGWREWVAVVGRDDDVAIKAKVDTGARTSALHAFEIREIERDGDRWLQFEVHPIQGDDRTKAIVEAPLVDEREVRNSGGDVSLRPVVVLPVRIGKRSFKIEITLVRRDEMGFRMLLGRQAVRRRFLVDPGRSFLTGNEPALEPVSPSEPTLGHEKSKGRATKKGIAKRKAQRKAKPEANVTAKTESSGVFATATKSKGASRAADMAGAVETPTAKAKKRSSAETWKEGEGSATVAAAEPKKSPKRKRVVERVTQRAEKKAKRMAMEKKATKPAKRTKARANGVLTETSKR